MSLLSEALVISGVAMDLVGATVLSHAHNAESMVDIREEIGVEKSALGEKDATQAQLLAEKRKSSPYSGGVASMGDPRGSGGTLDQHFEPNVAVGTQAGAEVYSCRNRRSPR